MLTDTGNLPPDRHYPNRALPPRMPEQYPELALAPSPSQRLRTPLFSDSDILEDTGGHRMSKETQRREEDF
jgi:hypothetical protein